MEEMNLEQPLEETSQKFIEREEKEGDDVISNGSILGKFQTVEELKKAYINLQSEFTKKSQKLSELLKRDNSVSTMQTQNVLELSQNSQQVENYGGTMQTQEPQYNSQEWEQKVQTFLANNPGAKRFAKEIVSMLLSDKVLASSPNSLDLAYGKILAKNFKTAEELLEDEEFINNLLSNSKIKQRVINEYLKDIQKVKVPTMVGNHAGSYVSLTPQEKPKSLSEASKIFEKMLKQK